MALAMCPTDEEEEEQEQEEEHSVEVVLYFRVL
jgi:hypothetical protein